MTKATEPTKARVVTKVKAMEAGQYPLQFLLDTVCGKARVDLLPIPTGADAALVASQLGARVVREVTADELRTLGLAAGKRVAIVRVATGMLVGPLQLQALPPGIIRVEQVAETGIARVSSAVNVATTQAEVTGIAKEIGAVKSIVGESVKEASIKGVTEASARFQVIDQMFALYRLQQDFLANETASRQEELLQGACCQAIRRAAEKVWKEVPRKYHSRSLKTRDTKERFYGKRRSRRN